MITDGNKLLEFLNDYRTKCQIESRKYYDKMYKSTPQYYTEWYGFGHLEHFYKTDILTQYIEGVVEYLEDFKIEAWLQIFTRDLKMIDLPNNSTNQNLTMANQWKATVIKDILYYIFHNVN